MSTRQRRVRRPKKKVTAVGDFIRHQLRELTDLALGLNGQLWGDLKYDDEPRRAALAARAAAIVQATIQADAAGGPPPPLIPPAAVSFYNDLASGVTFRYVADELVSQPQTPVAWRGAALTYEMSSASAGSPVKMLAQYFRNPARDRLRGCAKCSRWFVDATRNKSARRCSRECTIAWSNAQRRDKKEGSR